MVDNGSSKSKRIKRSFIILRRLAGLVLVNPFNNIILTVMLYANETWATIKREEQILIITQGYEKNPCWEYCYLSTPEVR